MTAVGRGIRLMLGRPLLTNRDDGFELVSEHREAIAAWFERHCGWQLHVERRYALLRKTGSKTGRPAAPFDRRRYELFCLACAELMEVPVTTAELLRRRVAPDEPEAFGDVLDLLERLGVIRPFNDRYRVERSLLAKLIEPSTVDEKHRDMRELVDEPVVYRSARAHRDALTEAGFVVEERAEGTLLVDPDGLATDRRFPDDGNAETAALTFLSLLAEGPASLGELEAITQELARKYQAYRVADAEELTREAMDLLEGFGLVGTDGDVAHALPAAARYRA